ncbi:MAG: deoxyuridine 5'-triphosphate nucleotidohydrolase [Lachnospiraceae bacterium]|nr:deoxyuridine 5'-triphosphate nucleotidohydrolase [Lachnospiraceae bacterium]
MNNTETIRIKYHSDKIEKLRYIDGKSDWIDLRVASDVVLKKGDFKLIDMGVSMQLPKGYEMLLVARSSTFKNFGLIQTNAMGVIDETYCGDDDHIMMPVYATRDTEVHVNDRICQFRIIKHQPAINFEETDRLSGESRGGFGSTGVN